MLEGANCQVRREALEGSLPAGFATSAVARGAITTEESLPVGESGLRPC